MSDTYDRIKEKEKAESLLQKAEILLDIDLVFEPLLKWLDKQKWWERCLVCLKCKASPHSSAPKMFPAYIQVIKPKDDADTRQSQDEWQGKIKALERGIAKKLKEQLDKLQLKEQLDKLQQNQQLRSDEVQQNQQQRIDEVKHEQQNQQQRIDEVKQQLEQQNQQLEQQNQQLGQIIGILKGDRS